MNISTLIPYLIAAGVVIVAALVIWFLVLRIRQLSLKRRFGPEYDYTIEKLGDRRSAEAELKERQKRVSGLEIHPLNENEKERYHNEWTEIQAAFVDEPAKSVENANRLITEVMIARGFPVADFEQRSADLSVLYPNYVPKYREANSIALKNQSGGASTDELRQAMIDYHSLFDQLLNVDHTREKAQDKTQEKAQENPQEKEMEPTNEQRS